MRGQRQSMQLIQKCLLYIFSGLDVDKDFRFLLSRQVNLSFTGNLVYEVHWYSFSDSDTWSTLSTNRACANTSADFMRKSGFLLDKERPLFMSEWGYKNGIVSAKVKSDYLRWYIDKKGAFFISDGSICNGIPTVSLADTLPFL